MIYYNDIYECEIGTIVIEADNVGVTALRIYREGREVNLERAYLGQCTSSTFTDRAKAWLDVYFDKKIPSFTPPLHMLGTPFQIEAWSMMLKIPYGKTATYGDIARAIAYNRGIPKMSAQAVGGAAKRNAIPIIIPCHRIVSANGPGGYGAGLDLKFRLLEIESSLKEE